MYSKLQDGSFIIAGFVAKDAEMKKSQNGKTYTNWSVKVGEKPSAVQGERGEAIWTNCSWKPSRTSSWAQSPLRPLISL